jgi:hypothetical protein
MNVRSYENRFVEYREGELIANRIDAYAFLECSSKTREGIKEIFEIAATAALQDPSKMKKRPRGLSLVFQKQIKKCVLI